MYEPHPDGYHILKYQAGWHYSTRIDENGHEVPDRRLHLNDAAPDERDWFYEYAEDHHQSWLDKHGLGNRVSVQPLPYGAQHTPQAYDTHELHQEWHRAQGSKPGKAAV